MIKLSIKHDLNRLKRDLDRLQKKQIPFATAKALTATAKHVQQAQADQLEKDFDNPTPFTKRGFYVLPARKTRLFAVVGIKDIQAKYLKYGIEGGIRKPPKKALVAPVRQRKNKYGNIPKGRLKRLMSKPTVFTGTVKGTAGVWERSKSGRLKLLISLSSEQKYTPRYDFIRTAKTMAKTRFGVEIKKSMREALRTAR